MANTVRGEMKNKLYDETFTLITEQKLYLMSKETSFTRIVQASGTRMPVIMWLDRYHRRLYYRETTQQARKGDLDETARSVGTDIGPVKIIDLGKLASVSDAPELPETVRLQPGEQGSVFSLTLNGVAPADQVLLFQTLDPKKMQLWMDGLCLAANIPGTSAHFSEEINALLEIEAELQILQEEQNNAPPVPAAPADYHFCTGPLPNQQYE